MKSWIFKTGVLSAPLIQRGLLAVVLFPHGAQKLLGWYDGYGFSGTMGFFTESIGLSYIIAFLVIMLEFFGPILLLLGLGVRLVSAALTILMLGIVFTSHWQHGFFMNWFGNQKGEGIEYFLLFLAGTLSLLFSGAGKWSIDRRIHDSNASL